GMGGLMTISVLESNKRAVQCADQLVLQPQRDIDKVRKYIHSICFKIESEEMLKEGDKFYNIINAVKGCEEYTEIEYLFGKKLIEERSSVLKEYVDTENNKLLTVLENMKNAAKENTADYERLNRLSEKYNEVMKCL
ncbi:MAG: tRNA (adenine(22)-N(1))-methyltransferase TrmK, partial [Clostridia bacterium]|nr:tRNA (adenine(22)-N(1))-methyltransferase TrmK [Clostridia bacterium]